MSIKKELFGRLPDGKEAYIYTLVNKNGAVLKMTDYGATLVSIIVPDRNGKLDDVIAGYDTLDEYLTKEGYQGATIGRFGNRIARSTFTVDGMTYELSSNEGQNQLHGGKVGFNQKVWDVVTEDSDEPALIFSCISPDGEEGFPGTLNVTVTYRLTKDNAVSISYRATTDKKTPVNLTNHAYFNIGGYASGDIREQILTLDACAFLPTDAELIPTGEIRSVEGTPFDFRAPKKIGKDITADDINIKYGNGYDHCFVFEGGETKEPVLRASLYDEASGRILEMYTDQPCVQIYTYNESTPKNYPFKNGVELPVYALVCLETEKMPDSVNHANFTNVYLNPGEIYTHNTIYKFSTK